MPGSHNIDLLAWKVFAAAWRWCQRSKCVFLDPAALIMQPSHLCAFCCCRTRNLPPGEISSYPGLNGCRAGGNFVPSACNSLNHLCLEFLLVRWGIGMVCQAKDKMREWLTKWNLYARRRPMKGTGKEVIFVFQMRDGRSTVDGRPCMPHWAACLRHRGKIVKLVPIYISACKIPTIQDGFSTLI